MKTRYYLAYGSNLNQQQMKTRCPDATLVGTAVLEGFELLFKGNKNEFYLTVEPCEDSQVPLGVWQVSEADEQALDEYEDYPALYYKKQLCLPVRLFEDSTYQKLDCFLYIMHERFSLGQPSEDYLKNCMQGYTDFHFDTHLLTKACKRSHPDALAFGSADIV